MKSKLCFFLIMFIIWSLFNIFTLRVLEMFRFIDSNSSYSWLYFLTSFVFSALASIGPGYFKKILLFILAAEFCWLMILLIQGNEIGVGYGRLIIFNNSFFVLGNYLTHAGAYWFGYGSGYLGLPDDLGVLVGEMIIIGISIILVLAIYRLSIRMTDTGIRNEAPLTQKI